MQVEMWTRIDLMQACLRFVSYVDPGRARKRGASVYEAAFRKNRRRGAVGATFALCLIVILGFAALAIDAGYTYVCRAQMQQSVDASALAGASGLWRNDGTAIVRAHRYAAENKMAGLPVVPDELGIAIGNWSGVRREFTPVTSSGMTTPNAIRVRGTRLDVPLNFGPAIGVPSTDIAKGATAIAGGGTCAGVWGLEGITADGDLISDSYDSRIGAYGPGNIYPNGDICSCSDIIFNGGVEIRGDAMYGYDHRFVPSGKSYEVWGMVGPHNLNVPVPWIDMAGASATNDNATMPRTVRGRDPFGGSQWDLYVTGNDSLTLPGGKYYLTSALIDGRAFITVTGPTEFYLSGDGTFTGGGIVNASKDPKNLVIYSTGSTLTLTGSSGFYGGVVAPNADIQMYGTTNVYGTVLGRVLDFDGDARIHVDEAMVRDLYGVNPVAPVLVQ